MHKRSLKRKILNKISPTNIVLTLGAILVSFTIVSISGAVQSHRTQAFSNESLLDSAIRIADAFEFYNQKRFN